MAAEMWLNAALGGVLGLLVGSFLNVVIHRLPQMMHRDWLHQMAANLTPPGGEPGIWAIVFGPNRPAPPNTEQVGHDLGAAVTALPKFDLLVPRSRCPHCGHQIRWFENVPILSWLALRGRCAQCHTPIAWRYPLVELATGLLFAWCAWRWGLTAAGLVWAGFSALLLCMTLIDWDTTLLPDSLTLPLLWAGLIASMLGITGVPLASAVWGAIGGYMSLWLVYQAFKLLTGKEGMGFGDFKLFAALGAWFGWTALVPMILMASVIGAIIGIGLKLTHGLREGQYVPFGPFLALAGLTAMVFGPQSILRAMGLG
ncbi:MAG: A24 family peptidase [Comamonadaceae bacterium]|nr:A24 family peptidase [Comamonadaceae bacterium]